MKFNLKNIAEFIHKHLILVSSVTKSDVEIVDENGKILFSNIEKSDYMMLPKIYRYVLETRQQVTIREGDEWLTDFFDGKIDSLIVTPLVIEGEVVACIGSMKFPGKKELDIESHEYFLAQTADFIATKWKEYEDNDSLYSMFSMLEIATRNMDEGAIVVNNKNEIEIINKSAKRQLNIKRTIQREKIEIKATGDTVNNSEEFLIRIGEKSCRVVGKLLDIPKNKYYQNILLFREMRKIQSNIYAMTSTVNVTNMDGIIGSSEQTAQLKAGISKVQKPDLQYNSPASSDSLS